MYLPCTRRVKPVRQSPRTKMYGYFTIELFHLVYCHRKLQRREELGASARIHLGRARPSGSRMRRARTLGAKPERSMEPLHTGELGLKCKAGSQLRQR